VLCDAGSAACPACGHSMPSMPSGGVPRVVLHALHRLPAQEGVGGLPRVVGTVGDDRVPGGGQPQVHAQLVVQGGGQRGVEAQAQGVAAAQPTLLRGSLRRLRARRGGGGGGGGGRQHSPWFCWPRRREERVLNVPQPAGAPRGRQVAAAGIPPLACRKPSGTYSRPRGRRRPLKTIST
jgi:hypothetical protein